MTCGAGMKQAGPQEPSRDVRDRAPIVLLVEDDEIMNRFAGMILSKLGCVVLSASGPLEALGISEELSSPIELLVTDIQMPLMSGVELAEHLARGRPGMKRIYISGASDELGGWAAERSGGAYLSKPFVTEAFITQVSRALDAGRRIV